MWFLLLYCLFNNNICQESWCKTYICLIDMFLTSTHMSCVFQYNFKKSSYRSFHIMEVPLYHPIRMFLYLYSSFSLQCETWTLLMNQFLPFLFWKSSKPTVGLPASCQYGLVMANGPQTLSWQVPPLRTQAGPPDTDSHIHWRHAGDTLTAPCTPADHIKHQLDSTLSLIKS